MRSLKYIVVAALASLLISTLSCIVSPTVFPFDIFLTGSSNPLGYWYPTASMLPANGTLNVPVNSISVIIFSMPVDPSTISSGVTIYSTATGGYLTEGALSDYEISMNAANTIATITFHYGGANPLLPSDNVQITLASTIREPVNNAPLNNPGMWQFTTGTAADITAPAISGGTNPTTGGIELSDTARLANGHEIHLDFSEAIDPNSVSGTTFYLTGGGDTRAASYTFNGTFTRAILTPHDDLINNTTYTVTVANGLTRIKDLAGNSLAAGTTWTFTTLVPLPDPYGAPTIPVGGGPWVTSIKSTTAPVDATAEINWNTNKPTTYNFHYGRNSTMSSSVTSAVLSTMQTVNLSAASPLGLVQNSRYWFYIAYTDENGASNSTATYQFNTESTASPTSISAVRITSIHPAS